MTKYFTQFDESTQTIGTNLAGWTVQGGGTPTRAPAYGDPATVPVKRRYLALTTQTAGAVYTALSWDLIDADANRANFDIVTCIIGPLTTVDQHLRLFARAAGGPPFTHGYFGILDIAGNIAIDKLVASVSTGLTSAAFTVDLAKSYFMRFRGNGTTLTLRVWDAALGMAGEPTTWNLTTTDASLAAAGPVGVACYDAAGTGEMAPFNFLAVGTNGDSAVCPRTNTEYAAWLDSQSAHRCALAEMSATGYDSTGSPYTKTVNVYLANHGYTSHQQDTPSQRHYDANIEAIPTFRREMGVALSGQASVGFGDLVVSNPAGEPDRRQNLLKYSNTFDNAVWTKTKASIVADAYTAPDGTTTADGLLEDSTTGQHSALQIDPTAAVNGITYTFTVDLLDGGRRYAVLDMSDASTGGAYAYFDLQTGVISQAATNGGSWTGAVAAMQALEGGWYRCSVTAKLGANNTIYAYILMANAGTGGEVPSYLGAGTAVVKLWNAHLREAARSNAYAATTSAQFNPTPADAAGIRDDWLRMKWNRNYLKVFLGDPSWPKHDFRTVIYGRLGMPTAPQMNQIRFPIADLGDILNAPVSTTKFSSGDLSSQPKPKVFGQPRAFELSGDRTTLVYTLNDGAFYFNASDLWCIFDVLPTAFAHIGTPYYSAALTISAVDAGTDVITASANHGFVAGYRVRFVGTPPAGVSQGTDYWVLAASLTATDFKITATQGSTTPVDITGTTTGAQIYGFGYTLDTSAGTVTLVAQPAGRVIAIGPNGNTSNDSYVSTGYNDIIFGDSVISQNFKDAASFTAAAAVDVTDSATGAFYIPPGRITTKSEVLGEFAKGTRSWYGFTPDGLVQIGSLALPAATAKMTFDESVVLFNTLRLVDTIRPIDFTKAVITYAPFFLTGGPLTVPGISLTGFGITAQDVLQGKRTVGAGSYSSPSVPLDDFPEASDPSITPTFDTLFTGGGGAITTRLKTFYKKPLGVYEFETRLSASQLSIGDTISLTHPRLGWKSWSTTDPASPDNTATIDSTKAVVIGIDTNIQTGRCKLKVFRQIPGYYPTQDLN